MSFKPHFLAALGLSLIILAGCTFPFFSTSTVVATLSPATIGFPTSEVVGSTPGTTINTLPVPLVTTTQALVLPPVSTVSPTTGVVPALTWKLIGVGCLSTTSIELSVGVGVPASKVLGVCTGTAPCSTASAASLIRFACQLVPNKVGQVYCYGPLADTGSALTACLQLPGSTQPVCNTFDNFQRFLLPCKCVSLYSTLADCNKDKNCAWNATTLKCDKKP